MDNAVLSSWKEIAEYLGKSVRTVQRWEHTIHLPVHRPEGAEKVVLAFPEELQNWVRRQAHGNEPARQIGVSLYEKSRMLCEQAKTLRLKLHRLCHDCSTTVTSARRSCRQLTDLLATIPSTKPIQGTTVIPIKVRVFDLNVRAIPAAFHRTQDGLARTNLLQPRESLKSRERKLPATAP